MRVIAIILITVTLMFAIGTGIFSYLFLNGLSGIHLENNYKLHHTKVACVGDSITYGHGVSNWHKNNYPTVLQNLLGDKYNVQNFGVSGSTVQDTGDKPYSKTSIFSLSTNYEADILVFMLGSNDSKPQNWIDAETFKTAYIELLDSYIESSSTPKVYLCTLSEVYYSDEKSSGPSTYDIQGDIVDIINSIIIEVAEERGYSLIDIYSLTSQHPEWFKDNIHPNKDGANAIAEEIYNNIK